jgi:hypothetical protein
MALRPLVHVLDLLSTWRGRFIALFVVAQLLLPLRYYIYHRDPHDERFAWRMFSPMRMATCSPFVKINDVNQPMNRIFHDAWIEIAKRGRFEVIEAMGAELCKRNPGKEVKMGMDCTYLDQPERPWGGYDMCSLPMLAGQ